MKTQEIMDSLKTKKGHPEFRVGDTLRVHVKIKEAEKERVQVFEGTVIKKRRGGNSASFTVRKLSYGTGVERIFPLESSVIDKIEVVQRGKVRRARLFYLRQKKGKATQIEEATPSSTETQKETKTTPTTLAAAEKQSAATAT